MDGGSSVSTCKGCGKPLIGRGQRAFCSPGCSNRLNAARRTAAAAARLGGRTCLQCDEPLTRRQQRVYCSSACANRATAPTKRKIDARRCPTCDRPMAGKPAGARFCSVPCYRASRRKAPAVMTCVHCGRQKTFAGREAKRARRQRYCSYACRGAALRTSIERTCATCGKAFAALPSRIAQGRGRYCSVDCYRPARRRLVERVCDCCGEVFARRPSEMRKGARRFCSRRCFVQARKKRQPTFACAHCGKAFQSSPSLRSGQQTFCSRACSHLAGSPTRFKCVACSRWFKSRAWRRPRFCSLSCANRRRSRSQAPGIEARNRLILELHAQRLKAPRISERLWALSAKDPDGCWGLDPPAVRQVIARAT
jgi:hypothetical protein